MRSFFVALILLVLPGLAHGFDSKARAIYMIDFDTGTVLLEKNAEQQLPPASMSKLMTLNMLFEALRDGRIGLNTKFRVSTKAWAMGGSKMFLKEGDSVSVENLIRGIIIQSGNDACVVVAEGLAGSEAEFANRMTRRAREMGMSQSVFSNATGWPHPDHRMSLKDLVFLANHIIAEFPEYYPYFAETSFTWENISQDNRNPLLGMGLGADGLKTGHTEEAGFGLVGSAVQDGRRVVFAIAGLPSSSDRALESERVLSWAFREFSRREMFARDAVVGAAQVWLGATDTVDLVAADPIEVLIPYAVRNEVRADIVYQGPIEAPFEAGAQLADLVVTVPGMAKMKFPLYARNGVGRGSFLDRMAASAQILGQKILDAAQSNAPQSGDQ